MNRCAWTLAAVFMLAALTVWTGCGDVFRPVANPIPGPTTDPRNFHIAVVVSQNAAGNPGSGMQIDVSGDSNVGTVNVGQQPRFRVQQRWLDYLIHARWTAGADWSAEHDHGAGRHDPGIPVLDRKRDDVRRHNPGGARAKSRSPVFRFCSAGHWRQFSGN
jgi:hypothetical protein